MVCTPRCSSQVQGLRNKTANVKFPSPLTRTRDSQAFLLPPTFQRKALTVIEEGFGSRHLEDTAPFSLWNKERNECCGPTEIQRSWILTRYKASAIHLDWPIVIIETAVAPSPLPVTVGCVAALFVPPCKPSMGQKDSFASSLEVFSLPSLII